MVALPHTLHRLGSCAPPAGGVLLSSGRRRCGRL